LAHQLLITTLQSQKSFIAFLVSAGYAIISAKHFPRRGISIFIFLLERQKKIYRDNPVNPACPLAPRGKPGLKPADGTGVANN